MMIFFLIISTTTPSVHAIETEQFVSEKIHLLNKEESSLLTKQALNLGAATTIKAHPSKEKRNEFKTFIESGLLIVNMPMDDSTQGKYLAKVSEAMASHKRINLVDKKPDGSVLTTFSIVTGDDNNLIAEVVIIVFGWESAKSKKMGLEGIMQSLVWYSVSRTKIDNVSIEVNNITNDPVVFQVYSKLLGISFQNFLLSL
jgi:hypothetical protein